MGDIFSNLQLGFSVALTLNNLFLALVGCLVGTLVGVGLGGLGLIQEMAQTLQTKGPKRISPYFIPASLANLAPGQLSMRFGFKGTSYTTTSACASGAHAIIVPASVPIVMRPSWAV